MAILSRHKGNTTPPSKIYVHSEGRRLFRDISQVDYFREIVDTERDMLGDFDYLIGIVWGDARKGRVADIFGYDLDGNWKSNPGVQSMVFADGIYRPREEVTCGEGLIILGREEEVRTGCDDLAAYMKVAPDFSFVRLKLLGTDEFIQAR